MAGVRRPLIDTDLFQEAAENLVAIGRMAEVSVEC